MMHHQPLLTIIATLVAGIFALILGGKVRLPSVLFFLTFGIFLGPQFANIIQPGVFRSNFPQYISILVALILFEGGISLKISQVKEISRTLKGLLTIGVLTTLVCVALSAHWLADLSWKKSILFGAVMIVTGPTVVIPILQRIRIKENLHNILKWEAILIDPLGVIIAVVLFELLVTNGGGIFHGVTAFLGRLAIGSVLGVLAGWIMYSCLTKKWLLQFEGEEIGGLFVLSTVLLFYGAAEFILPESGLVVATVAGIYFGNRKFALKDQIIRFKKQITLFALSWLFILLSANVPVKKIQSILIEGTWILATMVFVIRPLSVFLSTYKDSKLSLRDKIFISFMAPRGIVSASLASLFAIEFEERAFSGRAIFLPLAFHVIIGSILFYAVLSGFIAMFLKVREEKGNGIVIVGTNLFGLLLGRELRNAKIPVKFIDTNPFLCRQAASKGFGEVFCGSGFDKEFLESLDLKGISRMIAVTPNHEVNLLSCQTFSSYLGKDSVFRLWDAKESLEVVTSPAFDESHGKPLFIPPRDSEDHDVWDLMEGKGFELKTQKIEQPMKLTADALTNFHSATPLFARSGKEVLFLFPGASLPAESEILFVSRSENRSTPK